MKCLITAGGFKEDINPLKKPYPVPLLSVGNKAIIDYLCDDLYSNCEITEFTVVTNHSYVGLYHKWAQGKNYEISVVDTGYENVYDEVNNTEDIRFAVEECYLNDDCIIADGNTIYEGSLFPVISKTEESDSSLIAYGSTTDEIHSFMYMKAGDLLKIKDAINDGVKDIPSLGKWLSKKTAVRFCKYTNPLLKINEGDNYMEARRKFEGVYADRITRTLDKNLIPTCNIMGVNIASIDMDWLLDFTHENISELSGDYMCVSNVHTTVTAFDDPDYMMVQNGGIMAIPDGGPLSSIGRRRGHRGMKRTTGPSYMGEILRSSETKGYKHFFYGSTNETLDKFREKLSKDYPDLNIVGMYSPPFRQLTEEEDEEVIRMINDANADFVWVGLGAPKQEKWMAEHLGRVHGFMVGVGAGFDYFAGNIRRAPEWMQNRNLEWFYRLLQDPKRLFKRYWTTNTKFIMNAVIKGK